MLNIMINQTQSIIWVTMAQQIFFFFINLMSQYDININSQLEFLGVIDLTDTAPRLKGVFANRETVTAADIPIDVYSSWQFDSNTKIFLCAGINGIPNYYCSITSFNYWFTNPSNYISYAGQSTRNLALNISSNLHYSCFTWKLFVW